MAIKYLVNTANADNTISSSEIAADAVIAAKISDGAVTEGKIGALAVTEGKIGSGAVTEGKIASDAVITAKIAANAVTGAKLATDVNLPVGTLLNGTSLLSQIVAIAGGYDFKESVVTLVVAGSAQTIGGSSDYYNDSDAAYVSADLPNVPAYGFLINEATLNLDAAITQNKNRALVDGDRVAFSVFTDDAPAASKRTGIYTVVKGAGKGATLGNSYFFFTRATDANSATNFNLGALVYVNAGDEIGAGVFLGAGTFNTTTALFTLMQGGGTYTAGNGIALAGDSFSVAADVSGPVTVSAAGVSVQSASASVSGVITATQFKDLTRTVAASKESSGALQTVDNNTATLEIPVTAINTVVLVRAVVHSLSTTGAKHCVTEVRFAMRRAGTGTNSVLINDSTVTVFKEGDSSGITAMTVAGTVGALGVDVITITGVASFTINHSVVVTTQLIPNALSNA